MEGDNFHPTGGYVVIHHGTDGLHKVPLFLIDPHVGHAHHYTTNICRASLYAYYTAAKQAAINENEYLKREGHPLAGHIEVGEIFIRDYEPKAV